MTSSALKVPGSKVLVGDGPERAAPANRGTPMRTSSASAMAKTMPALLPLPTCIVFPSRTDTFGLVMLEAMACGTPVAAYDAPSPLRRGGAWRHGLP